MKNTSIFAAMNTKIQKLSKKTVIILTLLVLNVVGFLVANAYFAKNNVKSVANKYEVLDVTESKPQTKIIEFGIDLLQIIRK